jgi:hypothetical protein
MFWQLLVGVVVCVPCVIASITLTNRFGETFDFGNTAWCFLLNLAERYGWKPVGTEAPKDWDEPEEWPGTYDSSDGQIVTQPDAKALARAVATALDDDHLQNEAADLEAEFRRGVEERVGPELASVYEVGLGEEDVYRPYLEDFIRFCNEGAFEIE